MAGVWAEYNATGPSNRSRIVHEADLADEVFDAPEAAGGEILNSWSLQVRTDDGMLALTGPLFDGVYE